MIDIEVLGNHEAIHLIKPELEKSAQDGVRQYKHRGFAGEAGILGLVASILPSAFPEVVKFLTSMLVKDRDLVVVVDGNKYQVKDASELDRVMTVVSAHGAKI